MNEVTSSTRFRWAASDRYDLLKDYAKKNRRNSTTAENVLWQNIRNKQLGVEFRRQHVIGDFIVDFVCLDKMLVIEVDGGYHTERDQLEDDETRARILNSLGFWVVRFSNERVLLDLDNVKSDIKNILRQLT
jgi:very-short-patch-repair endonuclease